MKFKMLGILSLILVAILAMSAVCAAEDNATVEIISVEDTPESDAVSLDQSNDNQAVEDESNQTVNSDEQSNDVLGVSNEEEVVLRSASENAVLAVSTVEPAKLSASLTPEPVLKATKKVTYKVFKGKSAYKWKIKMSTWLKMKKQAKKQYYSLHKAGSSLPGYSKDIKVTLTKGGHKYKGYAYAVKTPKGIRCEVRLPQGWRATNWGDYNIGDIIY